ncbi:ribosome maturation factor RimM [Dermatophilus congolensis]|uniref:Ribosome maturation factor RimM n=1 Tax=Dermatophilus congolensis TaxID=1863 RepID=A0AA46GZT6_9MICO|nr:ribosome maturation factor RimM [Dermatophilus congolensis]MBO3142255.1 ribosome maturation factor RimM [Dermatophilus congolensis]MBO3151246.1 ribosome maturation factor RimM [Dermatophilus congolensis]MBO3161750.1 ribosome maturation factor RimM [Dermatophilus congolensis]MBO3162532.1 ribosome maturation factor RimM [Dermatophilus congolensis]MBO3176085.1 ribosome maturation factor RimM [Dermatophilus congolensis]
MQVRVARIGKPHGLRGEATVQLFTDSPEERFVPGAKFVTEPVGAGPLTVRSARVHKGIWLLGFEEAADRSAVELLRDVRLFVEAGVEGEDEVDEGVEDGFYEADLLGLAVETVSGERVGVVSALYTRPAQDLLEVSLGDGGQALVPFVDELVPEVDLAGGRVVIDPPVGLLELGREQDGE